MSFDSGFRRVMRARPMAASAVVLVVAAMATGTALAATLNGDGTFIGTTGADTISAGNANDTVWGLGGGDTVSVGNGNDMVDVDGSCPAGVKNGWVYTGASGNQFPPGQYCNHGHHGHKNATISAGNGNDTIYGGGGRNTIAVGSGNNVTIVGGPLGDTISVGSGGTSAQPNTIYLDVRDANDTCSTCTYTGSTVSVGTGTAIVSAYNAVKDTIACPSGQNNDTVYVDKSDVLKGKCAHIYYKQGPTLTPPLPARDRKKATRAKRSHKRQHKLHHSRHKAKRRSTQP